MEQKQISTWTALKSFVSKDIDKLPTLDQLKEYTSKQRSNWSMRRLFWWYKEDNQVKVWDFDNDSDITELVGKNWAWLVYLD